MRRAHNHRQGRYHPRSSRLSPAGRGERVRRLPEYVAAARCTGRLPGPPREDVSFSPRSVARAVWPRELLQSSSNRLPLDRTDGINSAFINERDLGAFFYFETPAVRRRFKRPRRLGAQRAPEISASPRSASPTAAALNAGAEHQQGVLCSPGLPLRRWHTRPSRSLPPPLNRVVVNRDEGWAVERRTGPAASRPSSGTPAPGVSRPVQRRLGRSSSGSGSSAARSTAARDNGDVWRQPFS